MYPLTRINDTMQELEGFHYATLLNINMGYYNIWISPASQEMITIVTEFEKFIYNCLPMGMCASGDISQSKLNDLLGDIEVSRMYTKDILVLKKESLSKHIEQLRIIFGRLRSAGLKFNAPKCNFVFTDIP